MDSNTWMFCNNKEKEYPVAFNGSEDEMRKKVSDLQERYRRNGCDTPIFIWTGYSWLKGEGPCYELTQTGEIKSLEAPA